MAKQEQKPVDSKAPNQTELLREANGIARTGIQAICPQFIKWVDSLGRWGGNLVDGSVLSIAEPSAEGKVDELRFRAEIFTRTHSYCISVHVPEDADDDGYLGCTASTRTPLAGEGHTRGNDLADGKLCQETWHRILADIVAYELVRLGK